MAVLEQLAFWWFCWVGFFVSKKGGGKKKYLERSQFHPGVEQRKNSKLRYVWDGKTTSPTNIIPDEGPKGTSMTLLLLIYLEGYCVGMIGRLLELQIYWESW